MGDEPEQEPDVRISDAERQVVIERLQRASAEGRISLQEFDERVTAVYAAKARMQLEPLIADLPRADTAPVPTAPPSTAAGAVGWTVALMGSSERRRRWQVARHTRAVAVMGGCLLDLREATLPPDEVKITAVAIMGGVEVVVPDGFDVVVSGFSLMGGYGTNVADRPRPPGSPTVRVRAFALMGGVDVKSKQPRADKEPG
jgi:hypothetical protein